MATLTHPAMLQYLDNAQNAAGHINENYARELMELRKERTRQINRIDVLLASQGVERDRKRKDFVVWLKEVRRWEGSALPPGMVERLRREYERLELIRGQIKTILPKREREVKSSKDLCHQKVRKLMALGGIGSRAPGSTRWRSLPGARLKTAASWRR